MLWFNGAIINAVDEVKSSGALFLVFIRGDDKLSQTYETFLNSEAQLHSNECLALKILYGSIAHSQFKAIYDTVPIPSVFLIGTGGIPISVVCNNITLEGLHKAIAEAMGKQSSIKTKNLSPVEEKNTLHSEDEFLSACSITTNEDSFSSSCSIPSSGPSVDLDQITKEELQKRVDEIRSRPQFLLLDWSHVSPPCYFNPSRPLSARIQFRLPTNEMRAWEFPDQSTLHDVRLYLMEKVKISSGFKLIRTYPRAALSCEDDSKTLSELNLAPSSTLIVVPVQDEAVQTKIRRIISHPASHVSNLMYSLLQPFFAVLTIFRSLWRRLPVGGLEPVKKLPSDTAVEKPTHKKTSTSNIHGFKFNEDSDSESDINTDNGNSTQQQ